jgi:hypothetical protein
MKIHVSVGELLDKFSILEIKKDLILGDELEYVLKEIKFLKKSVTKYTKNPEVMLIYSDLLLVNKSIWNDMELVTKLRLEKGPSYYLAIENTIDLNVQRSHLKRKINILTKSKLSEVKSYFAKG